MKLIALSQDKTLLHAGKTQDRMISYGSIVEKLVIVLFGIGVPQEVHISPSVTVIFAGGRTKISAGMRGMRALFRASAEYNLITAQDPFFLGLAALIIGRLRGVPVQIQVHTDCFSPLYRNESLLRAFQVRLAAFVLRRAFCVRAVSERVLGGVRAVCNAPVAVLPIRVSVGETSAVRPRPPEFRGAFTVLAVSRLSHEKQLHILIDAIALIKDVDLVIVGDGPLRLSLERRAKEGGVEGRVRFAGRQEDTTAYYQHANVFAHSSRYEGYGMTLMEAALAGLPMVTTDVGIVGDVLKGGEEVLIVAPNAEAFAGALMRLKNEEAFASTIGAKAQARAVGVLRTESEYLAEYSKALQTCLIKRK